jgi:hypothetical protein
MAHDIETDLAIRDHVIIQLAKTPIGQNTTTVFIKTHTPTGVESLLKFNFRESYKGMTKVADGYEFTFGA